MRSLHCAARSLFTRKPKYTNTHTKEREREKETNGKAEMNDNENKKMLYTVYRTFWLLEFTKTDGIYLIVEISTTKQRRNWHQSHSDDSDTIECRKQNRNLPSPRAQWGRKMDKIVNCLSTINCTPNLIELKLTSNRVEWNRVRLNSLNIDSCRPQTLFP